MADLVCPTCGPTTTEPHPRRPGLARCSNCKEHLKVRPATELTGTEGRAAEPVGTWTVLAVNSHAASPWVSLRHDNTGSVVTLPWAAVRLTQPADTEGAG